MNNYNIAAIATTYSNVNFRSRLEARYAAFFDIVGWKWEYEPIDLQGWTPDFRLTIPYSLIPPIPPPQELDCPEGVVKHLLLVEVKPHYSINEFRNTPEHALALAGVGVGDGVALLGDNPSVAFWVRGQYANPDWIRYWVNGWESAWKEAGNRVQWHRPGQPMVRHDKYPTESILEPRVGLIHPAELGSQAETQRDYLVDALIERGDRCLIVGPPWSGKSLLSLDLAVSLASMTSFLGCKPYLRPVRTAIISRKDGPVLVKRRLTQLAAGRDLTLEMIDPYLLANTVKQSSSFHIDSQNDLEEMARCLKAAQVEFCILDDLSRVHFQKENFSDDMARVMAKFDELAELSGAQICVIHARFGTARGSTAIDSWADFIFELEDEVENESLKRLTIRTKATGLMEPRIVRYWQSDDKSAFRILLIAKVEREHGRYR